MSKMDIGSLFVAEEAGKDIAVQLIGRNGVIGDIARVCRFDGLSLSICDHLKTMFIIGFPFSAAVKDGYLRYVSDCPIPEELRGMKFRFPNTARSGEVTSWTILSDEGQIISATLNQDQLCYPLAYAVNIEKLEELISSGWDGKYSIS